MSNMLFSHKTLAISNQRVEPADSLDFFPTPPFATRNFLENILFQYDEAGRRHYSKSLGGEATGELTAYDPCCGEGHMVEVLKEYFDGVFASDIHDYGKAYGVHDFLSDQITLFQSDWIVMNPPFNRLLEFLERALEQSISVAMFSRVGFLESITRYDRFFNANLQPTQIAFLPERLPIFRGVYNANGANRPYQNIWTIWKFDKSEGDTKTLRPPQPPCWLPTGHRKYIKQDDQLISGKGGL